jgi:hypothetical protein
MYSKAALMTSDDVRTMLREACTKAGNAALWAAKHDLAPSYVSDTLNGRREPGPKILYALGLVSEPQYRKAK